MHLSVIIPTLNRPETAKLLAGRIAELLPDLKTEVIVVTRKTSDGQPADIKIRYVFDESRGVYPAYNAGLCSATGEYVWFLGDDDYPLDAAAGVGDILKRGDFDVVIAPVLLSSGRIYRPVQSMLLLHFLNWCQQGVIYRRSLLLHHRFYRRLAVQADQYVNILLRSERAVRKKFLVDPICVFGVNGVSARARDPGYQSLRHALAHRTLDWGGFLAFLALTRIESLIKRLIKIR